MTGTSTVAVPESDAAGHVAPARPRRRWLRILLWSTLALVTIVFIYFAVTFFQVWRAARSDGARPSDAIVVLGAAQYDGVPSDVLAARLDHAIDLYDDGIAPTIVVTGGSMEGDRFTEATAAADYLHAHGVPEEAILRETTGRSSWESLAASARILEERGLTSVVLVSDPFHSARIQGIADELGLDAVTSPTQTSPITGAAEWRRLGTETVRVGVGRIIGFRRLMRAEPVGDLVPGLAIL
ncbi:MAG: YdcF family protein [Acidimicrobiia bacterium]